MSNASRTGAGKHEMNGPGKDPPVAPAAPGSLPAMFDRVDRDRLVSDLTQMIEIPSVNPFDCEPRPGYREQEMADFYLDRMSELGMEIGMREAAPGRPNVWGVLKGGGEGPSLMLAGHLDAVGIENYPDALRARGAACQVYGRGSRDMKAGLAACLEVARVICETDTELVGDLVIAGIANEEHLMIGSRAFGGHGPRADYGIIGEPSDLVICPANKDQLGLRIQTRGEAGTLAGRKKASTPSYPWPGLSRRLASTAPS